MSDNKISPPLFSPRASHQAQVLGAQFKNLRQPGTITVKGLAEAQHNATLGTWRVGVEAWGQDYAAALKANKKNLAVLQGFLKKQGFPDDALQLGEVDVSGHSESYYDDNGRERTRKKRLRCHALHHRNHQRPRRAAKSPVRHPRLARRK